ncbi:MAG TPA: hypothetical protein VFE23_11750 [Usitatibacter sp.]|jgi:hypothetical protein|nr:hypothetical protein [Usitatibacter sp.]
MKAIACYELMRNWRVGYEMRKHPNVPVVVANLGPVSLFEGKAGALIDQFESQLMQDSMLQFRRLAWQSAALKAPPDESIAEYMQKKYPAYFANAK